MKRKLIASVLGALALLLAAGAGTAVRSIPRGADRQPRAPAVRSKRPQPRGRRRSAPSNTNISVRVLSPGDGRSGLADQLRVVGRQRDELELHHSGCRWGASRAAASGPAPSSRP